MEITLILGLITFVLSIIWGAPDVVNDLETYLQFESFVLVAGGTIASTLISSGMKDIRLLMKGFKLLLFRQKKFPAIQAVKALVKVSEKAQTVSKSELVKEGKGLGDGFLELSLSLVGSGLDKDFINETLETEINEIRRRRMSLVNLVRTMGSYAPMFGMMGTVMGVVQVLKNVTDIDNIVSGMSLALLTTLYGLILSSVLFIPFANKLRTLSEREMLTKEIIREGIMMIMEKEIPLKVEKYLYAFIEMEVREKEKQKSS